MRMSNLNYQGIGSRLAAQIVDLIVLGVLCLILGTLMFGGPGFEVVGAEAAAFIGIFGLISFLYFIVLEGVKGATVGKMLMKIKVVKEDGALWVLPLL